MAEPKHPVGNYDVFVSFRGSDTRTGFVSHLYAGLKDAGIHVFLDNEELTYGERLSEELPRAIDNSKIYIPVLSENYASSKWCLRELSRMVENKKRFDQANEILPVFYKVTSDDVKLKSELFKEQLSNHRKKESDEVVEKWTNALKCIPERRGWEVPIDSLKGDAEFCREIIKRVSIMLKVKHKQVPEGLVGMEDPTDDLIRLLDIGSPDLQVIGIHGMGGIGKTTLAKVVYNKLCDSFDCCSFLYDVRETLDKDKGIRGCLELQKKLLKDICRHEEDDIRDVDDAVSIIRRKLSGKMVLLVFDDVSDPNQILKLIGNSYSSFNGESRIIITTRDRRVLQIKGFRIKIHEMEELNKQYALQLFSWHAFGRSCPPDEYSLLSYNVLDLTVGLPLSLEVIGSLLFREGKEKWKYIIQRLKTIPNKDVHERLKISYEDLSEEAKEIFLDIACFFVDKKRKYEIYMWEACEFFPQLGIDELLSMCLIKIKKHRYWMHDHIKDLGRQIIRQQGQEDQQQCTRFWLKEDAINILNIRKKEDNNIKVIRIPNVEDCDFGRWVVQTLRPENCTNLVKLRFLQLGVNTLDVFFNDYCDDKCEFEGAFDNHFPNLRWLSWHHIPPEQFNVAKFNLNKLVILDLSHSGVTESWGGWKQIQGLHSLEVLDLTWCVKLRRTPDLSQYTSLKRLILNKCKSLQEIDCSIIHLKALKYLHCTGCDSLKRLPEEVFTLVHLEEIIVEFSIAETIPKIPESVGDLTSLVTLTLNNLPMITLPNSIGKLVHLEVLNLEDNSKLQSLPDSIGGLMKLECLVLRWCTDLINLPDSLISLPKLQILKLSSCKKLQSLSDAVGELVLLKEMNISFSGLKKLPRFITMQKKLERLQADEIDFEAVPTEIEKLPSLRFLILEGSRICGLPSLIQLHCLEELNLDDCIGLDQLPDLPTSLVKLSVKRVSLLSIPDLSGLTCLTELKLVLEVRENDLSALTGLRCFSISSIRMLSKLKELSLCLPGFTITEPNQLVNLTKLEKLNLMCSEMGICVVSFPSRLRKLNLSLNKGTTSVSLTRLNRLESLKLSDCGDLLQIPGIGELESLKYLEITSCNSYERLDDISKLRHLTSLVIRECKKLTDTNSCLNKLSLIYLEIQDCPFLENKVHNRKPAVVDNASSCPSPSTLPESFPLPTIQAVMDVHQRFVELKQSAKETATRFNDVKNETDHVKASKELKHFEISALRAQLTELETKKPAEIDEKLHDATQDEIRSKDAERTSSEAWLRSLEADWNGWRAYLDLNGKMDGLSQPVWNPVGSSEQEPTDGLARGVDVNRFPASVDYLDDDTAHSSPNNAMSSFQMEFGISNVSGGQSKRDLEETDAQKEGSRDDDNGSSRKKLRLL